jgi:hypothetical protein
VIAIEIPGWMSEIDLQWLGEQAKHHDLIVEIGSYQGRSTRALGDNARGVVYAVDDWKGLRSVDKEWWENGTPESERETFEQTTLRFPLCRDLQIWCSLMEATGTKM